MKNVKKSKIQIKTRMKNLKKTKKKENFLKRNKKYSKIMRGGGDSEFETTCAFKDASKDVVICTVEVKPKGSKPAVATATAKPKSPSPELLGEKYSSLPKLLEELKKKTDIKNIYVFDFNDTLIMYDEDAPVNKKFPVLINDKDEMIDNTKERLVIKDVALPNEILEINENGNILNSNKKIISFDDITDYDIVYNLDGDMVNTTLQMLKDIQKNHDNIIIILSDSFQKFLRLYFNYKLSELNINPVFILGAIDRAEIKQTSKVWATKKANALKEISKTKPEANIFFYDSEKININKANELVNDKIKSFHLDTTDYLGKPIYELYEESKKP